MRILLFQNGAHPLFELAVKHEVPTPWELLLFIALGLAAGLAAVALTRSIYFVEDTFRKLPIHWMWWPAIGGVVVGLVGLVFPAALGVGYDVIGGILNLGDPERGLGHMQLTPWGGAWTHSTLALLAAVAVFKTLAWCVSLGSGTSGGVLAPILMIGGALGGAVGMGVKHYLWPTADPSMWALVCMAGVFAGTTRAPLTSIVFAVELTHDVSALLPLLLVCTLADLISVLLLPYSIMTEKIARRGLSVGHEYELDVLATLRVRDVMTTPVETVPMSMSVAALFEKFYGDPTARHYQSYPVVDDAGRLVGMVSQDDLPRYAVRDHLAWLVVADLMTAKPVVTNPDEGLRQAAQRMIGSGLGRLPVVDRSDPGKLVGILAHRDVLKAMARRLEEENQRERFFQVANLLLRSAQKAGPAKVPQGPAAPPAELPADRGPGEEG
jgi:CBS domain-containing protein